MTSHIPFSRSAYICPIWGWKRLTILIPCLVATKETERNLKIETKGANKNFEDARMMRELYFERELQTLEEIWNSTDTAWHWTFNASRNMEESIQDSIQKNGEEMFQMQENELKEMLERAKDTVESDQAIIDKLNEELARYSEEATKSINPIPGGVENIRFLVGGGLREPPTWNRVKTFY